MLPELLLIAAVGIYDPMDMSGHQMYPSGVKEADKYPRYAPSSTKMAQLTLPRNIIASDGRLISSGHYLVDFSISRQELLIFEGEKEIFALKISQTEILPKALKIPTAKFFTYDNGESFVIFTKGKYRVKARVFLDYL